MRKSEAGDPLHRDNTWPPFFASAVMYFCGYSTTDAMSFVHSGHISCRGPVCSGLEHEGGKVQGRRLSIITASSMLAIAPESTCKHHKPHNQLMHLTIRPEREPQRPVGQLTIMEPL